ncbi:uncharacterized protein LOC114470926 isoform X3 [Gouania willdenowi]|nr:uncharacterized protein LOC114470926 isoform X3 [Gouania willdenowi]
MRSSKVRGNKKPPVKNRVNKASPDELWNVPHTSVTDTDTLLEEVKLKCGEPLLHSTALEDDLIRSEDGAAAVEELRVELPVEKKKRRSQPAPTVSTRLVGKKAANGRRAEHALKSATNQRSMKDNQSGSSTRGPQPVEKSRSKRVRSDEEDGDDDEDHREKPSSGGGSSEEEGGGAEMRRRRKKTCVSELDRLVEAFHHFCGLYRKDVESPQDQHNILTLCENVTQLLTERVSASQELRALKRGNAKTASMIRSKIKRLLDGKHELMK